MSREHKWEMSPHTTPSGKVLHYCPVCGLYDPAPVKPEFEDRECAPDKYKDLWVVIRPTKWHGSVVVSRLDTR